MNLLGIGMYYVILTLAKVSAIKCPFLSKYYTLVETGTGTRNRGEKKLDLGLLYRQISLTFTKNKD